MPPRTIRTSVTEEEGISKKETSLRPVTFDTYLGQTEVAEHLQIYVNSAKNRGEALDHILLYGQAGLGKTTLAGIIANELGTNLKVLSAPAITKSGDIASVLNGVKEGDVIFIDEIHRLPIFVEETLYSAMEDYRIDILIGQGDNAKTISLELPHFTLIGATTHAGMLSQPLLDRFGIVEKLRYYTDEELSLIIMQYAEKFSLNISSEASLEIAMRSRGTPRVAVNLLRRVRDFALSDNIEIDDIIRTMTSLKINENGLKESDLNYLETVKLLQPVGLSTLAFSLGEDKSTIEENIEPYLIYRGFITKTPRGRILTPVQ